MASALHDLMDKAPLVAYPIVNEILVRMKRLCYEESRNDLMNQQLLRNMRVYEVVLEVIILNKQILYKFNIFSFYQFRMTKRMTPKCQN